MSFFMVFLNPSKQIPGLYLNLGYTIFLSYPFQFISHESPHNLMLVVSDTDDVK
jgi:hypothetical protein